MEALYFQPPALLWLMRAFTFYGSWLVLVPAGAAGVLLALRHQHRGLAIRMGAGMAAAEAASEIIKFVVHRTRPDSLHHITSRGAAFPSGHALNSVVVWGLLALVLASTVAAGRSWPRWLFVIPLLVGWTRVYLGVHWPSDVLSGWGLGLLLVAALAPNPPPGTPANADHAHSDADPR